MYAVAMQDSSHVCAGFQGVFVRAAFATVFLFFCETHVFHLM